MTPDETTPGSSPADRPDAPAQPSPGPSTEAEIDLVKHLDKLAATARRTSKESDQDRLWEATFGLDRWWCVPVDTGDGRWAPAAGQIEGVNALFAFSTEQRARRFAVEQELLSPDDPFQGAPTAPVDIVRNAGTYVASGVQVLMVDAHRSGHFLPMERLASYWEHLRGPIPAE